MAQNDLTPQWNTEDRVALRGFLAKNPNFIRVLAAKRPTLPKNAPAADRQLHGLNVAQHFDTIEMIEQMASDGPISAADLERP